MGSWSSICHGERVGMLVPSPARAQRGELAGSSGAVTEVNEAFFNAGNAPTLEVIRSVRAKGLQLTGEIHQFGPLPPVARKTHAAGFKASLDLRMIHRIRVSKQVSHVHVRCA